MEQLAIEDRGALRPLSVLGADHFENTLLLIARPLLHAHSEPESQSWQHALTLSVERLGEVIGPKATFFLSKYIAALLRCLPEGVSYQEPFCETDRLLVTENEFHLIAVLHHMRRDRTNHARDAVAELTKGRMDPHFIRAGLKLANRFPAGTARACLEPPKLSVVH
ncbi:MAG: hypothetical protein AAF497_17035 [Planctomycetota bacterium]